MTPPAKKAAAPASPTLSELIDKETPSVDGGEEKNTPVDNTPDDEFDKDENYDEPNEQVDSFLSPSVVSTVPNRTPAEIAAETPAETADRYSLDTSITKDDAKNPRVQVYEDTPVNQVPSGTHLHPDIAKDLLNRGISQHTTDIGQVKRTIVDAFDFAPDAEHNDKF